MEVHEKYMHRCLELAQKGRGAVAPNPMVGAVLVKEDKIIGEGWHQVYGQAHAEVNAVLDAKKNGYDDVSEATIYVSLEPCAHFGKTPPCADLIIQEGIKKVVIGCSDSFAAVNGKGVEKLKAAGCEVVLGVLEKEARSLNKRFFTFHEKQRPYIILKWAQTANGFIGNLHDERLLITNAITNRLVHKWRSEEAAIMVGSNTVLKDNPSLTNRYWPGKNPIRITMDFSQRLPKEAKIFNDEAATLVFTSQEEKTVGRTRYLTLKENNLTELLLRLKEENIQSVFVEGGAKLLQSFINADMWDEARVITNTNLTITSGIKAPTLKVATAKEKFFLQNDCIELFERK